MALGRLQGPDAVHGVNGAYTYAIPGEGEVVKGDSQGTLVTNYTKKILVIDLSHAGATAVLITHYNTNKFYDY